MKWSSCKGKTYVESYFSLSRNEKVEWKKPVWFLSATVSDIENVQLQKVASEKISSNQNQHRIRRCCDNAKVCWTLSHLMQVFIYNEYREKSHFICVANRVIHLLCWLQQNYFTEKKRVNTQSALTNFKQVLWLLGYSFFGIG